MQVRDSVVFIHFVQCVPFHFSICIFLCDALNCYLDIIVFAYPSKNPFIHTFHTHACAHTYTLTHTHTHTHTHTQIYTVHELVYLRERVSVRGCVRVSIHTNNG